MMVSQKHLYQCECDLVSTLIVSGRPCPVLPGYCVPELYAVKRPFSRGEKSQIDFAVIEEIIRAEISASMSERALLVHDIIANLLLTDLGMIYR
jgi:hypothetical protein